MNSKLVGVSLTSVVCLALGMAVGKATSSRFGAVEIARHTEPALAPSANSGMAIGPGAGVPVLRVFGDYECPACAEFEREAGDTLRALARHGRLRFVYHHAPLRLHQRGRIAAAAAYCTNATSLWPVHAALYDGVRQWRSGTDTEERLLALLAAVADTASLRKCMRSAATEERVAADKALADRLGIAEVPTILWQHQRLHVPTWSALVRFASRAAAP